MTADKPLKSRWNGAHKRFVESKWNELLNRYRESKSNGLLKRCAESKCREFSEQLSAKSEEL